MVKATKLVSSAFAIKERKFAALHDGGALTVAIRAENRGARVDSKGRGLVAERGNHLDEHLGGLDKGGGLRNRSNGEVGAVQLGHGARLRPERIHGGVHAGHLGGKRFLEELHGNDGALGLEHEGLGGVGGQVLLRHSDLPFLGKGRGEKLRIPFGAGQQDGGLDGRDLNFGFGGVGFFGHDELRVCLKGMCGFEQRSPRAPDRMDQAL